jgi:hypothetical protein
MIDRKTINVPLVVELQVLNYGQPRPYADTIWEAILTINASPLGKWVPTEEMVKKIVREYFYESSFPLRDKQGEGMWYEDYFDKVIQKSDGSWLVRIISPYKD